MTTPAGVREVLRFFRAFREPAWLIARSCGTVRITREACGVPTIAAPPDVVGFLVDNGYIEILSRNAGSSGEVLVKLTLIGNSVGLSYSLEHPTMSDPVPCISVDAAETAIKLRRKIRDVLLFKLRSPTVTISAEVCCDPIVIDDPTVANGLLDNIIQGYKDQLNALGFCADDIV